MGFIEDYFINPILNSTGYNIYNTLLFAAVLIVSLFCIVKLLKKLKIKMNGELFYSLLPFVFLGGVLRALQDKGVFAALGNAQYLFVTPLIYFVVFFLAFGSILISRYTKTNWTKKTGWGLLFVSLLCVLLNAKFNIYFFIAIGLAALVFLTVFFCTKSLKSKLLNGISKWPLIAHTLDSCSSVTAISIVGTFHEQHVVPSFIFSYVPFWFFIPVKAALALGAIYLINTQVKNEWKWMLTFAITVLGLGPGVRNSVSLLW